jgi:GntR family transcriptional regulator of vanillate catabolism
MALRAPAHDEAAGATSSQSMRAQLRLRELIVGGSLPPGERITELAMVERLTMSRTPIRTALVRLQEEGLLEALPGGGFVVRAFSDDDIHDAIELRGTLEGLAARMAAERGVAPALMAEVRDCLGRIDALLAPPKLSDSAFAAYAEHNGRLHALLSRMSGSPLLQRQIDRAVTLPFASPNGFVMADRGGPRARDRLVIAHEQHHAMVDAIARGEGTRAEALAREHARNAQRNLATVLIHQARMQHVQGVQMLRRRAAAR